MVNGGAKGIRTEEPLDISAIRRVVDVPFIGLYKIDIPGYKARITLTFEATKEVVKACAYIVALDAALRPRPKGLTAYELIKRIKKELEVPVMANISAFEERVKAFEAGADLATTIACHTLYTLDRPKPDLELLQRLVEEISVPMIAEGHYHTSRIKR